MGNGEVKSEFCKRAQGDFDQSFPRCHDGYDEIVNESNCGIRNYVYNRRNFMKRNEKAFSIRPVAVPDEKSRRCMQLLIWF